MNPNAPHLLWPDWIEFAKAAFRCDFIAQGTLINKHSIGRTIGDAKLHGPVLAAGVRRVFNFALVDENYEEQGGRYRRSSDEARRATLNIVDTGDARDNVNGILFSTSPNEVDALAEREYGYDLLPVLYRGEQNSGSAYMFIARKESQAIGHRVLDGILPNESSLSICLSGAATYGRDFLDAWIESCHLANGTPLMHDRYYEILVRNLVDTLDG